MAPWSLFNGYRWSSPVSQHFRFDASRSLTALEQDCTIVAVIEMSHAKWLVAALVPGVERQPLKKSDAQEEMLLKLLHRWRCEGFRMPPVILRPPPVTSAIEPLPADKRISGAVRTQPTSGLADDP